MNIDELRQERAKLIAQARAILDKADEEKRELTAEEEEQYRRIDADIDKLAERIKREERMKALEGDLNKLQNNPIKPEPEVEKRTNLRGTDEYRQAFWTEIRQGRTALEPVQYRMLQEVRSLSAGSDTAGGYLVPEGYEGQILDGLQEENVMRRYATIIRASSDRNIPVVDSHGVAYWTDEEGAYTESDESFGQRVLRSHKVTALIKVSEELLQDSAFDLEGYILNEFVRRIAAKEEAAFINGDGVNKPKGVLQDAGVGKTAASATAVTADELIDLYHSIKRPYRRRAIWMANDSTIKAIRKLKDSNNQYLWQPGMQAGEPDTLFGRPVAAASDMPEMASGNKSILFGDLSFYWIADRQGRVFQRLGELYATTGQVGFRTYQRVDGLLTITEAVKVLQQA